MIVVSYIFQKIGDEGISAVDELFGGRLKKRERERERETAQDGMSGRERNRKSLAQFIFGRSYLCLLFAVQSRIVSNLSVPHHFPLYYRA